MEMPAVRQHGPDEDECGSSDLRLYRKSVLEPRTDTGDPRPSVAPVKEDKMDWKDSIIWLLRFATVGILLIGILLGLAIGKIF